MHTKRKRKRETEEIVRGVEVDKNMECAVCVESAKATDFVECPHHECRFQCCATCAAKHVLVQTHLPIRCPNAECHHDWSIEQMQDMSNLYHNRNVQTHLGKLFVASEELRLPEVHAHAHVIRQEKAARRDLEDIYREREHALLVLRAREQQVERQVRESTQVVALLQRGEYLDAFLHYYSLSPLARDRAR